MKRIRQTIVKHRRLALRLAVLGAAVLLPAWTWVYLRPDTWAYYTDEIALRRLKRDVEPRLVLWDDAQPATGAMNGPVECAEPALSPDGAVMVFTRGQGQGNADLFFSRWDGAAWGAPWPARALNSPFHERSPAFSHDGRFLFFATDRPGGPGAFDIWVSRWDGAEFAWPVPLTRMVNTPYDELGPEPSANADQLYFCSNRPRRDDRRADASELDARPAVSTADYDIFSAAAIPAGVTNREVERATSMLYYLREAALRDPAVMRKLGGSEATEQAVDRAIQWLAANQETDGRWSLSKHGGSGGHDVGATSFALLAYFGRGYRPDRPNPYRETIGKGLAWLVSQQTPLGGLMGTGNLYDHGIATLALSEAYGLTKDENLLVPAQRAVDFLVDCQNESDGGWRYNPGWKPSDMSSSGWQIMALKNAALSGLSVPERSMASIRRWLESVAGGLHGGLYGYQGHEASSPAMRATGYFCSQLMGLSPNTLRAFETSDDIMNRGVVSTDLYYAYYGTLAANQNQGPSWPKWRAEFQQTFLPLQQGDGRWAAQGQHADRMGDAVTTALVTLSLQAHYRYTPMYGLGYTPDKTRAALSVFNRDALPEVPVYRRAKRRMELSSPRDDLQPAVTGHGDFLYFASDRAGGHGGLDIYRARISGPRAGVPRNLGSAVNSADDESDPAPRMAGFDLLFCSNRGAANGETYRAYHSLSRQVRQEFDYANRPAAGWLLQRYPWRIALVMFGSGVFFYWLLWDRRAVIPRRRAAEAVVDRLLRTARRWLPPIVSLLLVLGCLLSLRGSLKQSLWCYYTDGGAIRRSALDTDVRLILWDTHLTPAPFNVPTNEVAAAFSADDTELRFTYVLPGAARPAERVSTWNGHVWSPTQSVTNGVAVTHLPPQAASGGWLYCASNTAAGYGGFDIYRRTVLDGQAGALENLGLEINSRWDETRPAVRMAGFDLLFCSNRRQEDGGRYLLYTATAREVAERIDFARWHSFVNLFLRLKWWLAALCVALVALFYMLRRWHDITSLFHKCLAASIIVHLLALLLMAFWIISTEFMESMDSTVMEIAVDVDALAREKLALELEQEVTEFEKTPDALVTDRRADAAELPTFEPAKDDRAVPVVTEASEHSFVTSVEPSMALDTELPEPKEVTRLPAVELPALQLALALEERPEGKVEVIEEQPSEPSRARQDVEVARAEPERPATRPGDPEIDMPRHVDPGPGAQPRELAAAAAAQTEPQEGPLESAVPATLDDVPELDVQAPAALLPEMVSAAAPEQPAIEPATLQPDLQTKAAAQSLPRTRAEALPLDASQVGHSALTNLPALPAKGDLFAAAVSAVVPEWAPSTALPDASLPMPDVPGLSRVRLEAPPDGATGLPAVGAPAARTEEASVQAAAQHGTGAKRAAPAQPLVHAVASRTGARDIARTEAPRSRAIENPVPAFARADAIAATPTVAVGTQPGLPAMNVSVPDTGLELPAQEVRSASADEPPPIAAAIPSGAPIRRGKTELPAPTMTGDVPRAADIEAAKAVDTGGVRVVLTAGIRSDGHPPHLDGTGDVAHLLVTSSEAVPALRITAPGSLAVPAGPGRAVLPEVLKDPSRLSDETIEGLGGSGDTQRAIAQALDWFSTNQERDGRWSLARHGGKPGHDVGGTALVLLCYYGWGAKHNARGPQQDSVKRALDWLLTQMGNDGDLRGWVRRRYEEDRMLGNMYDHAIATIALCEAYGLTDDDALREPAQRAVRFLLDAQEQDLGGWRYEPRDDSDTSVLGWAYMALKSAELAGIAVPNETFARADKWLAKVAGGETGGIYGYQQAETKRPAMIATGMFCRQLSGIARSDPRMHESAGYIATHPLEAAEVDYYYLYYATLAMYQHQGEGWEQWNERMKDILLACQHKTGRQAGAWDPQMWYGDQMGLVVSTALSTLSLEVYYRILPIYGFATRP